ncbi:MAG: protoheme IX farnesyltransferase [Gemmatimonadaceae bacterium]|nr:protoheme IX farnesyltransferase [Gemmatimonadaceae bacterium]
MTTETASQSRPLAADLLTLTKPRIISLLLVTTAMPMYAAGSPDLFTLLVVMAGGYLMAGGANAMNMYFDRDIDGVMSRTHTRPLPSGRMAPKAVLAFGIACATAATFMLGHLVNAMTATLALAGFYGYAFVYTRWLKRTTPQNIVLGGAAGAFPPLVGWAAMTGGVDLRSIILFLIVFYWTPPHFWALALNKQVDYGRAGIPMAPNAWGTRETIDQMWWYSVLLAALTLLPVCIGMFGITYLGATLLLNAIFLHYAWRVKRHRDADKPAWSAPAWTLYKYSLLYLALLFAAMAVDRHL